MVSIIIVNWNSADFLGKCLHSIHETTPEGAFEIIVIDNASFDASKQLIDREFPKVLFIQSNENAGFAKANNAAYDHAKGETLLFLNPDTEIIKDAITLMESALNSDEKTGIVGCKLLNSDKSFQTSCVQPFPTIFNQVFDAGILHKIPRVSTMDKTADFKDVEAISGACLMIKRSVFKQVGKFSSDYFMYAEDTDLCYKVNKRGYRVCYVDQASVIHHGGKSSTGSGRSGFGIVLMRQSIYIFFAKFRGKGYANDYRIAMFISAIMRLIILVCCSPLRVALRQSNASIFNPVFKWYKIGRWSLGLENWVKSLPSATQQTVCAASSQ